MFALRTWLALGLALFLGFVFELKSASSAGVCVMLLAQPVQGMILSKAIYRTLGTLTGVTAAVAIIALFPQDRVMILAAFTVWMGLCTAAATVLRDFRAYGTVLAGYSVAIISIANIDTPNAAFPAALDRIAAILLGVAVITFVNALLLDANASRSLGSKLQNATLKVMGLARRTLDSRSSPDPVTCLELSAILMPLRSQISFAGPELPDGRRRAQGARSALLGLFEMLYAIQAVGAGLAALKGPSAAVDEAVGLARRALRAQRPEQYQTALDQLATPLVTGGTLSIEEAYVLDRISFMFATLAHIRDGKRGLRTGRAPRRMAKLDVHQDKLTVLLNFVRVVIAVGAVCFLGVASGQAATAEAVLFTAVYVSLGSISPDPSNMSFSAIAGLPVTVIAGAIYVFFIFPVITGYPLFVLSLAPLVLLTCWLMSTGQQGLGAIIGTMTVVLTGPSNPQALDPAGFVQDAVMFIVSGLAIFLSFRLVLPVQPAQRRLRLALTAGTSLRQALADEGRRPVPRASLHFDRLAQFKQWLGTGGVTVARRKTLTRVNDIGNLAFAVRRAWRAIDSASGAAPPELEARARRILPALAQGETVAVARDYLAAATGQDKDASLALAHAAAALFGTALGTGKEARLLRRVGLLNRFPVTRMS